jgi:hypothetical protein
MMYRIALSAAALLSCLALPAIASEVRAPAGFVSGPASGTNVVPSTAIQKQMFGEHATGQAATQPRAEVAALIAVGAPGVEGAPDTQSGCPGLDSRRAHQ